MKTIYRIAIFFSVMVIFNVSSTSLLYASEPQVVDIKLGSYYIRPDKLTVKVGKAVTLSLVNEATLIPHNFVIQAPDADINIKVDVSAGKSSSVSFTPTKIGVYEITCTKKPPFGKSHKEKGMHGVLEVVP